MPELTSVVFGMKMRMHIEWCFIGTMSKAAGGQW